MKLINENDHQFLSWWKVLAEQYECCETDSKNRSSLDEKTHCKWNKGDDLPLHHVVGGEVEEQGLA